MTSTFIQYNEILQDAYKIIATNNELVQKKTSIIEEVINTCGNKAETILFIGHHPSSALLQGQVYVTDVKPDTVSLPAQYIDRDRILPKSFDQVFALDEYLTFFSDHEIKAEMSWISKITKCNFTTSLRDYKNQDYKTRDFSQPHVLRNHLEKRIYLEHYDYDFEDRYQFIHTGYVIGQSDVEIYGPYKRKNLFFKQLAKLSTDFGSEKFLIHKNLMHRSVIKKTFEHLISLTF